MASQGEHFQPKVELPYLDPNALSCYPEWAIHPEESNERTQDFQPTQH